MGRGHGWLGVWLRVGVDLARKSGSRAFDATGVVRLRIGCCSGMIRVVQPSLGGSGMARCDGPDLFEWHETDNRWVGPLS